VTRSEEPPLPPGCRLHALETLPDRRGDLTEMFREAWFDSPSPRSWHVVRGSTGACTGVRVYARDWLYVCLMGGGMSVGLTDLRPTPGGIITAQLVLSDSSRQVLVVAPGVAYGFYFPQRVQYLLGRVEAGQDPAEHLLCAWNSPDLDVAWPPASPESPLAEQGSSFAQFKAAFSAIWAEYGLVDRA
jgi:dTDP-4-dehydrorhamnose 3,5-epimerase